MWRVKFLHRSIYLHDVGWHLWTHISPFIFQMAFFWNLQSFFTRSSVCDLGSEPEIRMSLTKATQAVEEQIDGVDFHTEMSERDISAHRGRRWRWAQLPLLGVGTLAGREAPPSTAGLGAAILQRGPRGAVLFSTTLQQPDLGTQTWTATWLSEEVGRQGCAKRPIHPPQMGSQRESCPPNMAPQRFKTVWPQKSNLKRSCSES